MPWWLLWKRKVQGADVGRLEAWRPGGPSLAGGDFRGARLRGRVLLDIDLSKSTLDRCGLREAELSDADLSGARLNHADLRGANLKKADLSGAELVGADLRESSLEDANLSGILTQPDVPEDLKTTAMEGDTTSFAKANLSFANLTGANLRGADLRGAYLSYADLSGVKHDSETQWPDGFDMSRLG